MRKACTGEGIRGERNQHKVRVHDVWGSCHATVMLCLTCLGLVAAVDVTTFETSGINMSAFHIPNITTITNKQPKLHKLYKLHNPYKLHK